MNTRLLTVIALALGVASAATYLVNRMIENRLVASATGNVTPVLLAGRNIELGSILKNEDLRVGEWKGTVPPGMAVKKETLLGRGVVSTLYEGEPIMESRLAPAGAGGGLAATIPAGMRACAVRVNDVVGLGGFVVSGMRVDVLVGGTPPGAAAAGGGSKVKTVLQNIQVLSAGTNYQKDNEGKPLPVTVVNLLVTPEQAEVLSLASNETRIQLVLRNPLDTQVAKTNGSELTSLFGENKPAPAPRTWTAPVAKPKVTPPPQKETVTIPAQLIEVINGSRRTELKFDVTPEGKK